MIKKIKYSIEGEKNFLEVKLCGSFLSKFMGLMFKKSSPPLLFIFKKTKRIEIHSFFCRPFRAIWLDEDMNATKIVDVRKWKRSIYGRGKYLLEIPLVRKESLFSVENSPKRL